MQKNMIRNLKSMLLNGVDEKVEMIKIKLSQKDCEECGKSELQKENMDFLVMILPIWSI